MSARRYSAAGVLRSAAIPAMVLLTVLGGCAEAVVGIELAKRANRALDASTPSVGATNIRTQQQQGAISPYLEPAPEVFEATGIAQWDGKRTLQGVWVAHPLATTARRVRIFNSDSGLAVDGALFKRDAALGGASVLISSEAAEKLGIEPGGQAALRIVAVTPAPRSDADATASTSQPEDQTAAPVESEVARTEPEPTPQVTPAPRPEKIPENTATPAPTSTPEAEPLEATASTLSTQEDDQAQPVTQTAEKPKEELPPPSDQSGEFKWEDQTVAAAPPQPEQTKPAAEAQPAPVASKLRLPFIQAGVFGVRDNAVKLVQRLQKRGIPAEGKRLNSKLTRVVAGPFGTEAERAGALSVIRKMGMRDAVPVRK